jgi:hypothetical protein
MINLKVKLLTSIKDRTIGLIGYEKPEPIMFLTRFGIHTFGLKFPIDVLVLDKNNKVVKLVENLKPNNLFDWPIKYNRVIELPTGYIKKNKVVLLTNINLEIDKS